MDVTGLIVGLGNPGLEYAETRHNFGYMAVDSFIGANGSQGSITRISDRSSNAELWKGTFKTLKGNSTWFFAKPLTYMNKSGEAVQRICSYYKISPEDVFVLHDELDLPLGRMKFKRGGGNAGHNGLRSIQQHLSTPDFLRLRLGIGKPVGFETTSFVLGRFSKEEQKTVKDLLAGVIKGITLFMHEPEKNAQQFFNSF